MSEKLLNKPRQLPLLESERKDLSQRREGVSVDLAARAFYLLNALDNYSKGSRLGGFEIAATYNQSVNRRHNALMPKILSAAYNANIQGNESFRLAYGAHALIAAGYDADEVDRETIQNRNEFIQTYIGAGNQSKRDKFRRQLRKQIIIK